MTKLEADFLNFHKENPDVYDHFKKFTFEKIRFGYKHYSSRAVIHRVRWETDAGDPEKVDGFKINNNHSPYYARMFMWEYPQFAGFFRNRTVKSD